MTYRACWQVDNVLTKRSAHSKLGVLTPCCHDGPKLELSSHKESWAMGKVGLRPKRTSLTCLIWCLNYDMFGFFLFCYWTLMLCCYNYDGNLEYGQEFDIAEHKSTNGLDHKTPILYLLWFHLRCDFQLGCNLW